MAAPTITVEADPEALRTAMAALEEYQQAREQYGKDMGAAKAALDEAHRAYEQAEAAALTRLEDAKRAAVEAGVSFPEDRPRRRPSSSGGARAPRVSQDQVRANVMELARGTTSFTVREAAEKGGTPATVTKVIKALVADGKLTDLGPDPHHSGQGRAPTLYART